MTNDSLIEKLQRRSDLAAKESVEHKDEFNAGLCAGLREAIYEIRQTSCEIPVVDEARSAADKVITDHLSRLDGNSSQKLKTSTMAWAVYVALIPYLRTTEPVSSAPECECDEISNGETCVKCGPSSEQPDQKPLHVITSTGCSICGTDALHCSFWKTYRKPEREISLVRVTCNNGHKFNSPAQHLVKTEGHQCPECGLCVYDPTRIEDGHTDV